MPIGLSGNLHPGIAACVRRDGAAARSRSADGAVARAAAADGDAARAAGGAARAADDDGDELLAGRLGADAHGRAATGGSARAPTARSRTRMPVDERKRRRAAAPQAWRVRRRELTDAAEAAAAQDGPLADEQWRALDGRDCEQAKGRARGGARDRTGDRATGLAVARSAAGPVNDSEEREELAVAAAVITRLADKPRSATRRTKQIRRRNISLCPFFN